MPVADFRSSPTICVIAPVPPEAYVSSLGRDVASATYSLTEFAGTDGCTTITSGVEMSRVTATSFSFRMQHGSGVTRSLSALLITPWNRVEPSGAERATSRAPIMLFAPGRFSTITGWPSDSDSLGAMRRGGTSNALPGPAGTIQRTSFEG